MSSRPSKTIKKRPALEAKPLEKIPSGIAGLDLITGGGLPKNRPTLVCGSAGCGKTLFAMEFLLRGVLDHDEPGVFMTFEETPEDLAINVGSLGLSLENIPEDKLVIDHVQIDRTEIEETGEYDLEGLFVRLGVAIDSIGAKRVVLDTIEALFASFKDQAILRGELRRLFTWLKERKVTTIITGERGDKTLTRNGLDEYVSDCVILLDHRIENQVSTRRLRIVKYRGSSHGTNEYPFLIDDHGISVLPVTSLGLDYPVSTDRISSGVPKLDEMLSGRGYFRGTSVLVTGGAGTGKSSLAAHFVNAACARGETCIYFALEEPTMQVIRNMRSIGVDLEPWRKKGLLHFQAVRPSFFGLEMHLATMHKLVVELDAKVVVVDPISSLLGLGSPNEVKAMMVRLFDFLKMQGVTTLVTCLTTGNVMEETEIGISSLIDTWLQVRDLEHAGERNRGLYILKSRGMPHSNQVREFLLTSEGIDLVDVQRGPEGVLIGSARVRHQETLDGARARRSS